VLPTPFLHTRLRVRKTPGIPCALCFLRDIVDAQLGRNRAAGMLLLVYADVVVRLAAFAKASAAESALGPA
jgi:hypothetical protein